MVKDIFENDNFDELVKDGISFVDFGAVWCGPCQMLHPNFEEASEKVQNVKFMYVDVDQNARLTGRFGIRAVPSLFLIKDGNVIASTQGYMDTDSLIHFIESNIN